MNERYSHENLWRAYKHIWFVVARSCDIDIPMSARLLDHDLVVFRDIDGAARVTDRRCVHRGGDLAAGRVTELGIQCPYHGWCYQGADGKCSSIPSLPESGAIPRNAKINSYSVLECYEHVWACLGEPYFDIPKPPEIDDLEWLWLPGEAIQAKCGLMAAMENFRDMAHFPFVHTETMGGVPTTVPQLDVKREGRRVSTSLRYNQVEGAEFSQDGDAWMYYHSYAPGFAAILYDYDDNKKRYLVDMPTPVSQGQCVIHKAVAVELGFSGRSIEEIRELEDQVFAEDTPILEGLTPSEVSLSGDWFEASCPADIYTQTYRRATMHVVDEILEWLDSEA